MRWHRAVVPLVLMGSMACRTGSEFGAGDAKPGDNGGGGDGSAADGSDGADDPAQVDADGDGWTADEDCDDGDPAVSPGAAERCNGIDDDCDAEVDEGVTTVFWTDGDGDGYGDAAAPVEACALEEGLADNDLDCADDDPASYPGAPEVCDGLDNDCDSLTDEDVTITVYVDGDGDGYGEDDLRAEACAAEVGYAAQGGDCAPADPAIHPGALEVCDGLDNDCDGDVDDEDASLDASTGGTYYADADGDRYGDPDAAVQACEAPAGTVDNGADCDDRAADISPLGTEICDGLDNDCNGTPDDDYATDAATWYADADADGFGDAANATTACAQPASAVADATDCDDTDGTAYPGSHEIETPGDGIDTDCDGNDFCEDLNCDGWPDLVFPEYRDNAGYAPESTVYYGSASGFSTTDSLDLVTTGASGVVADDIDGDGYVDLFFTSYYDGNYVTDSRIYWGSAAGHSTSDVTDLPSRAATGACIADLDSDGYKDIVVAQYYSGSSYVQSSVIYWGSSAGWSATDATDLYTIAARSCAIGDVDADGYPDLLFSGYTYSSNTGYAYLYYGSSAGYSTADLDYFSGGRFGNAYLEDVDGDGYDDVLLPNYYDGNHTTYSQLWYGSGSGLSTSNLDYLLTYGAWSAAVGDYDGDGRNDIAFASYYSGSDYSSTGTWVYYQGATGFTSSNLVALNSIGGRHIRAADLDGDGVDDLVQSNLRSSSSWEVDSFVWMGGSSGPSSATRADLPTWGSYNHAIGDLDGDGYAEVVFSSYVDDAGDYEGASTIYWGAATGFSATTFTDLPADGVWRAPAIVGAFD